MLRRILPLVTFIVAALGPSPIAADAVLTGTSNARSSVPTAAPAAAATPTSTAPRHELGQSLIFLRIYTDSLIVRVEVTTEDLEAALGFGWDPDAVTVAQVRSRLDSIRGYVEPRFGLYGPDGVLPLEFDRLGSLFIENARFVQLHYRLDGPWEIPEMMDVFLSTGFDLDDDHRNLVVVEHNWRTSTFFHEGVE
ncbi:MAG: hypothetical protein HKO98_03880, partial [Gemmatimonadetes bacterium]|nr:hypothetical protein [Gemmatimonadota bacterium]